MALSETFRLRYSLQLSLSPCFLTLRWPLFFLLLPGFSFALLIFDWTHFLIDLD